MAQTNVNAPYGLKFLLSPQAPVYVQAQLLASDSGVVGVNDPVAFTTNANGILTVTRATAASTNHIHGVVVVPRVSGWQYTDNPNTRPASVLTQVVIQLVTPSAEQIWSIQTNNTTNYSATQAQSGAFYALSTVAAPDTVTGISTVTMDPNTGSTTGQLFCLGLDDKYGGFNQAGDKNAKVQVYVANTN